MLVSGRRESSYFTRLGDTRVNAFDLVERQHLLSLLHRVICEQNPQYEQPWKLPTGPLPLLQTSTASTAAAAGLNQRGTAGSSHDAGTAGGDHPTATSSTTEEEAGVGGSGGEEGGKKAPERHPGDAQEGMGEKDSAKDSRSPVADEEDDEKRAGDGGEERAEDEERARREEAEEENKEGAGGGRHAAARIERIIKEQVHGKGFIKVSMFCFSGVHESANQSPWPRSLLRGVLIAVILLRTGLLRMPSCTLAGNKQHTQGKSHGVNVPSHVLFVLSRFSGWPASCLFVILRDVLPRALLHIASEGTSVLVQLAAGLCFCQQSYERTIALRRSTKVLTALPCTIYVVSVVICVR